MSALGQSAGPPYLRIAAELRDRIASGELGAGEKIPSTRGITREWGVAMATATKALAVLRQEGLVRAVPGVGTVVAPRVAPPPRPPRPAVHGGRARSRPGEPAVMRERIVATAVAIADRQGSAALSLRAIAAELGLSTMALYRHVSGKGELVELMMDAVFAGPLPEPAPAHWRARLEAGARRQWALHRGHPWLAKAMSFTRPPMSPHAMAHMEWSMAPLVELGLDVVTLLHIAVTVAGSVRAAAMDLEDEVLARQDTGMTSDEWMTGRMAEFDALLSGGDFPMYGRVAQEKGDFFGPDSMFEFMLARLLDGLEPLVAERRRGRR
ncbi:TetR/AcrR family transcriptional regulator C-terminal domain-containing protein [Streptomyces sp. NPDC052396]|uniref:TetR/AcrR family transcriptional regulator C-terminal domain-containing protein n=1 Tax=Streptomyces sp. NPDC052396 TaxID=3365689 RepID=UPI0037D33014